MPIVLLGSCIGLPGLPLIGRALNVPLARLERDRMPYKGDKTGFAFRGQETLGKNPTFF